jgi:hypothetical protein
VGIVPELQGTPEDIAAEKCRIAAEKVGGVLESKGENSRKAYLIKWPALAPRAMYYGRHLLVL